jgi:hypothetical protein
MSYQYLLLKEGPMFVMVQHTISDPETFWSVDPTTLSKGITLHHSFATPDGTRATCIWEADSVDAIRNTLEPVAGRISRNEYFTVENREGLARPSRVAHLAGTAGSTPKR